MTTMFDALAEARIQEWLRRKDSEPQREPPPPEPGDPLEVQLLKRILELRHRAESAGDPERHELSSEAGRVEVQLMTLLETTGRPLAARRLAERLHPSD